jgi:hypothetical protein
MSMKSSGSKTQLEPVELRELEPILAEIVKLSHWVQVYERFIHTKALVRFCSGRDGDVRSF